VPSKMTRNRGTLWPRSELHHIPIRPDVMSALAGLAEARAEHDVAEHLIAYRGDEILLEWYDAIYDPIFVSTTCSPSGPPAGYPGRSTT
jgi:hypothetical protein